MSNKDAATAAVKWIGPTDWRNRSFVHTSLSMHTKPYENMIFWLCAWCLAEGMIAQSKLEYGLQPDEWR